MTEASRDTLALLSFKILVKELFISTDNLEYVHEIGEGEFALVEKGALTTSDGDKVIVAVKSFKPYVVSTAEDLRELVVSAVLLKRLHHPHVAGFYGIGCFKAESFEAVRSSVFFVEEFIGGYTLQKLLTEQMRNPYIKLYKTEVALKWCIQLAEALEYLHSTEPVTIHADVKCQNVFLTDEKLTDAQIRLADLKPHKHVYAKNPSSLVARPELQQASLMQCRSYRSPGTQDDSAHGTSYPTATLARTHSLPTPDALSQATGHVGGTRPSSGDLDSAASSPPENGPSAFPLVMSTPDLQQLHPKTFPSPPHPLTSPFQPTLPPSPEHTVADPVPPRSPTYRSPTHPPGLCDIAPPDDQDVPPGVEPRSLSWDPLDSQQIRTLMQADGPSISIGPLSTSAPAMDLHIPSYNRHISKHLSQVMERAGELVAGAKGPLLPPHARHQMECKQHGASQAYQALKAIHVISEEAPLSSSGNVLPAFQPDRSVNPSVNGSSGSRRVRFSNKIPQGKTPSRAWGMLYMAPEMVKGLKYNEKVDVFSFGVVMFELLGRSLLTGWSEQGTDPDVALIRYAEKVAEGHREPLPKMWPEPLQQLVSSCWHPDPHLRPRMTEVVTTLKQLVDAPGICDALDNIRVMPPEYTEPFCRCTIS